MLITLQEIWIRSAAVTFLKHKVYNLKEETTRLSKQTLQILVEVNMRSTETNLWS